MRRTHLVTLEGVDNFFTEGVSGITGIFGVLGDEEAHFSGLKRADAVPGGNGDTQSTNAAFAP